MKTAEEWNSYYRFLCSNDPAVHGQLLPNPQNITFIKLVQEDALRHAADIAEKMADSIGRDNPNTSSDLSEADIYRASGAYQVAQRLILEIENIK